MSKGPGGPHPLCAGVTQGSHQPLHLSRHGALLQTIHQGCLKGLEGLERCRGGGVVVVVVVGNTPTRKR